MDIFEMSILKIPSTFFFKSVLLHYLEHDVGNSSNSYKYFCDDDFFELKKVNRTFLDIFKMDNKTIF